MSDAIRNAREMGRKLASNCVEILYPPRCAGCGRRGFWVCTRCFDELQLIEPPLCVRCGVPAGHVCVCAWLSPALDQLRSAAWYDGWLKSAVQLFKYEGEFARDTHLASLLSPLLDEFGSDFELVPVPLHPERERRRGYNQADRLAVALSKASGIKVARVLERPVMTRQQVGLSAIERAVNVRGAFSAADGATITGRRFVFIDDVTTTGATVGACADALKAAGASWVGVLTLARER